MTEELREKIDAILEAGELILNPPDDLAEFINKSAVSISRVAQILQAFNQWLEEQKALHAVMHPEISDIDPCVEPLRLE